MKHYAMATWRGSGLTGSGTVTIQSNAFKEIPYSFNSRFRDEPGTKPEELLAAAHASDFTMKLSFVLEDAGFMPKTLSTKCTVDFEKGQITASNLLVCVAIKDIAPEELDRYILDAMNTCPLSIAMKSKVNIEARLQPV